MYKLLIADDERRIRNGLRNCLNWNELGIEIIEEAEDGEIALKIARKLSPNLMLLDICMPLLNGLELIKRLKDMDQNCMIIIITGYDEFEYMHEALKLKVFDYILKPVNKENLKDVVSRAIQELNNIKKNVIYLEWANKQLVENLNVLKHSFFNNWFKGNLNYTQIIHNLDFLKINLETNIGILVIKPVDKLSYKGYSQYRDKDLINFAIINIVCELLKKYNPSITYVDEENNIVIITNTNFPSEWIKMSKVLETQIFTYLHYTVVTEQRIIVNGVLGVQNAYKEIINTINNTLQFKPVVFLAIRYINSNYFIKDFSLEMVAEKFNVSSSYLSRLLKQDIGLSFIDYLTNLRIKKAISLLDEPVLKIYEIAEAVGYANQHYFCKTFKKVMGFSPTEYRGGCLAND